MPRTAYNNADAVLQIAFSLIMLNTGLHVEGKKAPGKRAPQAVMTVDEYIKNTRNCVEPDEVPDEALRCFYESIQDGEIRLEPLPVNAFDFDKLPVQPNIEGWLIAVLGPQTLRRYWAVLLLQRMYLFADCLDTRPSDAVDLKDLAVCAVPESQAARDRIHADLQSKKSMCLCLGRSTNGRGELEDNAEERSFELYPRVKDAPLTLKHLLKPRTRLALLAETRDLMEKWVNLISSGPY